MAVANSVERDERRTPLLGDEQESSDSEDSFLLACVTVSHFLTNVGWHAWQFVIPLYLLSFDTSTSGAAGAPSVLYAGFFGLGITLSALFFSPHVGSWADALRTGSTSSDARMRIVTLGIVSQVASVVVALAVICLRLEKDKQTINIGATTSPKSDNVFSGLSRLDLVCYVTMCLSGIVEKLGTVATLSAVKKDWLPTLFIGEKLAQANSVMSRADLAAEVLGPFIAGLAFTLIDTSMSGSGAAGAGVSKSSAAEAVVPTDDSKGSVFAYMAVVNLVSFLPQYVLLRYVFSRATTRLEVQTFTERNEALHEGPSREIITGVQDSTSNSAALAVKKEASEEIRESGWSVFFKQEHDLWWNSVCFALCWFNALSPHGVVLTAYLAANRVDSLLLSIFRGLGAAAGACGVFAFRRVRARSNLGAAASLFMWILATGCSLALFFAALFESHFLEPDSLDGESRLSPNGNFSSFRKALLLCFLGSIVLSRVGLYAFELASMELSQLLVIPETRLRVSAVESALCSSGTLFIYVLSIVWSRPSEFVFQVCTSWAAVQTAAIAFDRWRRKTAAVRALG
ncbi:unnamed protein product [Amoebophrya sp. A25]|nr:unnamed protein product [Amoebophrya sp. A25]|eukprot:GSA25T00023558001.1